MYGSEAANPVCECADPRGPWTVPLPLAETAERTPTPRRRRAESPALPTTPGLAYSPRAMSTNRG